MVPSSFQQPIRMSRGMRKEIRGGEKIKKSGSFWRDEQKEKQISEKQKAKASGYQSVLFLLFST
jgi:hypothetical protein